MKRKERKENFINLFINEERKFYKIKAVKVERNIKTEL